MGTEVPGLQHNVAPETQTHHRKGQPQTLQGKSAGNVPQRTRAKPWQDYPATHPHTSRMDKLLPSNRAKGRSGRTRPMAQAQATYAPLATVEAASYASPKLDEKRTDCSTCSAIRKQRARPVVERERLAHESGVPQILVRSTRLDLASGHPAAPSRCIMNRRMRNRTSGGVGGPRGQPRLLPDLVEAAC